MTLNGPTIFDKETVHFYTHKCGIAADGDDV
jgi:hypothetical protein